MPDFDIDFSDTRRGEVIEYVRERYGDDKVAHIATFGTLASRAAIKDAARVLEAPFAEADAGLEAGAARVRPLGVDREALEEVPEMRALYEGGAQEYVDVAMSLEGLTRHASVHAAGVIIARDPCRSSRRCSAAATGRSSASTTWARRGARLPEDGLPRAAHAVVRGGDGAHRAADLRRDARSGRLPARRPAVFELLSRGDAAGVFQFESPGMVDTLKKLKPRRIQDLIAVSALYRPGPMENIPTYIRRHHGVEEVTWDDFPTPARRTWRRSWRRPTASPSTRSRSCRSRSGGGVLAGRGGPAAARDGQEEARGDGAAAHRVRARRGARGIPADEANRIFDLLEKFANYGFNKSHSAAYTLISYQTAYLKAHYPVAFAAALLTVERGELRQGGAVRRRRPPPGHRGAAARRQRVGRRLHAGRRGDPLRPLRRQERRRHRRRALLPSASAAGRSRACSTSAGASTRSC
jgi:DNA polymerase III subunit alpha